MEELLPDFEKMKKSDLISYISDHLHTAIEQSTTQYADKPQRNDDHPTSKPVPLVGRLVANSSCPDWITLDAFGGSGATLIACEQLGRMAYLMEYEPVYVDVMIRRFVHHTGCTEGIIRERDGIRRMSQWHISIQTNGERPQDERGKPAVKRGVPVGNRNAKGHGAPLGNQNNFKHGAYAEVYWDSLSEEECRMVEAMTFDEEQMLEEQIALLTVRERRLLKRIDEVSQKGLALNSITKRKYDSTGNPLYDSKHSQTETTTKTVSTFEVLQKLEGELTRVQTRKMHCIEALRKIRTQKESADGNND